MRKEDAKQKPLIINGNFSVEDTQYTPLFASMKLIVGRYASMNENAGVFTLHPSSFAANLAVVSKFQSFV